MASAMADCLSSQSSQDNLPRVFCVVDDEEMRSGVSWESAVSSMAEGCRNFALIVESNRAPDFIGAGLRSLGWKVSEAADDFVSMSGAFADIDFSAPEPRAVLIRTEDAEYGDMPLSTDEVDSVLSGMENETAGGGVRG